MSCAQGFLIFLNVLMIIKGLAGIVVGILTFITVFGAALILSVILGFALGITQTTNSTEALVVVAFMHYIFIAIGVLGLFLGIWGLVGAAKRNKCLLVTAAILLFLLLAVEVVLTVFTAVGYSGAFLTKSNFDQVKGDTLNNYQDMYMCCGIDGPGDYSAGSIPAPSCCVEDANGDAIDEALCKINTIGYTYQDGCGKYTGKISTDAWIPIGVLIGVSVITLFTFIMTIALSCTSKKDEYY